MPMQGNPPDESLYNRSKRFVTDAAAKAAESVTNTEAFRRAEEFKKANAARNASDPYINPDYQRPMQGSPPPSPPPSAPVPDVDPNLQVNKSNPRMYMGPESQGYNSFNASPARRKMNRTMLGIGGLGSVAGGIDALFTSDEEGSIADPLLYGGVALGGAALGNKYLNDNYRGGTRQFATDAAKAVGQTAKQGVWNPLTRGARAGWNNVSKQEQKMTDADNAKSNQVFKPENWNASYGDPTAATTTRGDDYTYGRGDKAEGPMRSDTPGAGDFLKSGQRSGDAATESRIQQGLYSDGQVKDIRFRQAELDEARKIARTFKADTPGFNTAISRISTLETELADIINQPAGTAGQKATDSTKTAGEKAEDFVNSETKFKDTVDAGADAASKAGAAAGEAVDDVKKAGGDILQSAKDKLARAQEDMKNATVGSKTWRKAKAKAKRFAKAVTKRQETINFAQANDLSYNEAAAKMKSNARGPSIWKGAKAGAKAGARAGGKGVKALSVAEIIDLSLRGTAALARDDYDVGHLKKDVVEGLGSMIEGGLVTADDVISGRKGFWDVAGDTAEGLARETVNIFPSIGKGVYNVLANVGEKDTFGEAEYKGDPDSWFGRYDTSNYGLTDYGVNDIRRNDPAALYDSYLYNNDDIRKLDNQARQMFDGRTMQEEADTRNLQGSRDNIQDMYNQIRAHRVANDVQGLDVREGQSAYDAMPVTAPNAFEAGQGDIMPVMNWENQLPMSRNQELDQLAQAGNDLMMGNLLDPRNVPGAENMSEYDMINTERQPDMTDNVMDPYTVPGMENISQYDPVSMAMASEGGAGSGGGGMQTRKPQVAPGTEGDDRYQAYEPQTYDPQLTDSGVYVHDLPDDPNADLRYNTGTMSLADMGINDFSGTRSGGIRGTSERGDQINYSPEMLDQYAAGPQRRREEREAIAAQRRTPEYIEAMAAQGESSAKQMEAQAKMMEVLGADDEESLPFKEQFENQQNIAEQPVVAANTIRQQLVNSRKGSPKYEEAWNQGSELARNMFSQQVNKWWKNPMDSPTINETDMMKLQNFKDEDIRYNPETGTMFIEDEDGIFSDNFDVSVPEEYRKLFESLYL